MPFMCSKFRISKGFRFIERIRFVTDRQVRHTGNYGKTICLSRMEGDMLTYIDINVTIPNLAPQTRVAVFQEECMHVV